MNPPLAVGVAEVVIFRLLNRRRIHVTDGQTKATSVPKHIIGLFSGNGVMCVWFEMQGGGGGI